MKLIIQIPCFNEAEQLPQTLADLPRGLDGFDVVRVAVIDDGSTDDTIAVARAHGVDHLVRLTNNKGLAAGFQAGIDTALKLGADVIVNTDADNQYYGGDVARLVRPILEGRADMVVGDREVGGIEHFSPLKKLLQRLGSWVVRQASSTSVPDTTSGFRAYNREAAIQMMVVSKFTYTLETIIQAGKLLVAIDHVPVRTNPKTRESRLFPSMSAYVRRNAVSIFRIYAQYEPLRVFWSLALVIGLARGGGVDPLRGRVRRWQRQGPRAVADPRRSAVHRRSRAVGARGDRRPAGGAAGDDAAHLTSACGASSSSSGWRRPTMRQVVNSRRGWRRLPRPAGASAGTSGPSRRRRSCRAKRCACEGPLVNGGGVTLSEDGVVTGNTFDKYGSGNPLVRRLMAGFERDLDELLGLADPGSVLDVGCGEGVLVHRWARRLEQRRVVGVDLEEESIQGGWAERRAPNLEYRVIRDAELPFAAGEFELASAIEVLEHVPDPQRTLEEMARCASRHLLVSVPREPLWRMLNMARGAYWPALGNTPGHVNHWSRRSFVELLSRHGEVAELRAPFPWTMLLVRL